MQLRPNVRRSLFGVCSGVMAISLCVMTQASADVTELSLQGLVEKSDRIVHGRVLSGSPAKEVVTLNDAGDAAEFIFTYVEIEPIEHLKGTDTGTNVVVRLLGGYWEDYVIVVSDAANIEEGEEVLLFLRESSREGRTAGEVAHFMPYRKFAKFRVQSRNGRQIASRPVSTHRLDVPAGQDVGENWIDLAKMKQFISAAVSSLPKE